MSKPTLTTDETADEAIEKVAANAHARIEGNAERVKQAASNVVAGTKDAVDRAAERVEEGLHEATDKVAGAASKAADLGERGREAYDAALDRADEWLDQARDYVREKPVQSVAIALGAGWLLGRILRH